MILNATTIHEKDGASEIGANIFLVDGRKDPGYYNVNIAPDGTAIGTGWQFLTQINASVGDPMSITLALGRQNNTAPLTPSEMPYFKDVSGTISGPHNAENFIYYTLTFSSVGTGSLVIPNGNEAYSIPVTVAKPTGFYTALDADSPVTTLQYTRSNKPVVYFITETGLTAAEAEAVKFTIDYNDAIVDTYIETKLVARDAANTLFDIKITFKTCNMFDTFLTAEFTGGQRTLHIANNEPTPTAECISHTLTQGNRTYVIGFGALRENDKNGFCDICEGNALVGGYSNDMGTADGTYSLVATPLRILAATPVTGSNGSLLGYLADHGMTGFLNVTKIWIEPLTGDRDTFALSPDGAMMLEGTNLDKEFPIFIQPEHYGYALIWATVKSGNEEFNIRILYFIQPTVRETIDLSHITSMEALQKYVDTEFLDLLASTPRDADTIYTLKLAPITYEGTLTIPDEYDDYLAIMLLAFRFTGSTDAQGNRTTIKGGINLNNILVLDISGIDFVSNGKSPALFGGGNHSTQNCTFTGYDIAIDGTGALEAICSFTYCEFVNNGVAILIDYEDVPANMSTGANTWNRFINNGTAVRILSTNWIFNPFLLRFSDSDFIGNDTDFDVQCDGTFYFYRNYYADDDTSNNKHHTAIVSCTDGDGNGILATVHTKPRRSQPIEYDMKLIVDANEATTILNSEAERLPIEADSLDGATLCIVDDGGNEIGQWNFAD